MSKFIFLYVWGLRSVWVVALVLLMIALGVAAYLVYKEKYMESLLVAVVSIVFIVIYAAHMPDIAKRITAVYIDRYGIKASGRIFAEKLVIDSVDSGQALERGLYIQKPEGQIEEFNFWAYTDSGLMSNRGETWTYPRKKFIRYPKINEEFEVKYIEGLEKFYIILNEGNSPFAYAIKKEREDTEFEKLKRKVQFTQIRVEMDKFNLQAREAGHQAEQELEDFSRSKVQTLTRPQTKDK